MPQSFDSSTRPINTRHYRYESASANDHEFETYNPQKRSPDRTNKWLKIGLPVLIVLIAVGVVVGVLVSRHHDKSSTSSNGGSGGSGGGSGGGGGSNNIGIFYTTTDAYGLPVYPSTVRHCCTQVRIASLTKNMSYRPTLLYTALPRSTHHPPLNGRPTLPLLLLRRRLQSDRIGLD